MTLFDLSDVTCRSDVTVHSEVTGLSEVPRPTASDIDSNDIDSNDIDSTPQPSTPATPEVEVRVSARRKKTSEAKWVAGRIVVSLPAHLDVESRQKTTDWLVERLLTRHRQQGLGDEELLARAIALSERYLIGTRPASVRWVTNQTARWGSCSYGSGQIRLSHRLRVVPEWVLDSVLVHEVAHLTHPDHSPAFHRLAAGYPRHEEAGLFLAGYGLGLSNPAG